MWQVRVAMGHWRGEGFLQIKVGENERGRKQALGKDQLGDQDPKAQREGAEDPLRSLPE